jgi:hypothetical protein
MTKDEFVSQLDRGAAQTTALPVTSAILRWTADQLRKSEPAWWKPMAKAWEKRTFNAWTEAWSLYLTCLHYEALSDAECDLVPYFPSCGGTAEADPSVALARFHAHAPPSFYEHLRAGHRRTFIATRAPMWMGPAMSFFQRRDLPYYLVEVNSGAGLNLAADVLSTVKGFDSALIAARVGLDVKPMQTEDLMDRRWLTAGIWPDDLPGITDLDAAIDKVNACTKQSAAFIQLAECPAEKAAAFVTKNIPSDDTDVGLLIFNMGTTVRMSDAEYASYAASIANMLKGWGERAIWIEFETVRGETYSTTFQLRAHRLFGGQPRSMVLSSVDVGNATHQTAAGADAFLGPVVPQSAPTGK